MNVEIFKKIEFIFQKQNKLSEFDFEDPETTLSKASDLQKIIENETRSEQPDVKNRIQEELAGFGPLAVLIDNDLVTEVLVNSFDQVYYEMKGTLIHHDDHFFSDASYMAFIDRLSQKCHTHMNREKPFVETQFGKMRVTMIFSEISRGHCRSPTARFSTRAEPIDH